MIVRDFWLHRLRALWRQRPVVWLSGVRRVGKTSLCHQVKNGRYFNCDLPSVQRQLADPESFFSQQDREATILLDEVHRIADPAMALKIAADEFPGLRILATGSSTLQATGKFRDSLTDRKRSLFLPPVLWRECLTTFAQPEIDRRLLHGGLPGQLLAPAPDPAFFEDWMDSFYARDVQELFGVRNRTAFMTLLKLVAMRNGGLLDITDLARQAGISRPTVMAHLDAMEIAHAVIRVPPYHGGGHREVVNRPRIYLFDTGLTAHIRGWESIREDDRGLLWENLVLDELRAVYPQSAIHYWRDRTQREIDFVVERPGGRVDAIEAKINPDAFEHSALSLFRQYYPDGRNLLACPYVRKPYTIRKGGLTVQVCSTPDFA